jgi:hypothetical protein
LPIAKLQIAGGDIVRGGVTQHMIEGHLRRDPAAAHPDHRCQFGFVFNALGLGRDQDWLVWTDQGRGWLEKQQGHFGHFGAVFAGMRDIISPDAQNFRGLDRR